jgi:cytochrome c-type biogenesis protein CcmH/NrfG
VAQPATPSGMPAATGTPTHPMPTMDQMKKMADTMVAPLLAQLKTNPNDPKLLTQLGALYGKTHQFKEAAEYYDRATKADPKDVETRNELATSLYYAGDVDGALSQLQQSLKYDPKNVNALFNLGMVRWKGKNDSAGAVEAWKQLLKSNPGLDRKPIVEKMIAEAQSKSATTASN